MAITIELQQVIEEDDGTYTVTVNVKRDGSRIMNGKSFSCTNAAELKAKIKPKFEALIAVEQKREHIRALAQGVLDEIQNEVQQ